MKLDDFNYVLRCDLCGVDTAGDRTFGLVVYDHASAKRSPGRYHLCGACGMELQEFLQARRSAGPGRAAARSVPRPGPLQEERHAVGEGARRRRRRRRRGRRPPGPAPAIEP